LDLWDRARFGPEVEGAGGAARADRAEALRAAAANAAMVVGQVCGLMTVSPAHKHLFIADLEWALMPPVMLRQFSMVRQNNRLAAFVSWASVSDEIDARLQQGVARLKPTDWRSGDNLWIIDVIAPFGRREEIIAQVREKVFAGKAVQVLAANTRRDVAGPANNADRGA
jgi:cytolysin-activating lysine-acyltransferase